MSNFLTKYNGVSVWNIAAAFILTFGIMLVPDSSFAAITTLTTGQGTIAGTICNVIDELQGPIARGVAAFGIIFLGFSLFLGKISWGVGLALGIGLGAIFGAGQIVAVLGNGEEACV